MRTPFQPRRVASAIPAEPVLRVAVWCAFLVIISFTSADPDLWGHVRFGMDILRDGTVHHVDTYSFASDRAWINHEWGAELLAGWAFVAAGNPGLVVLKLLIIGSVLLLLNTTLRIQGITSGFLRDVTAGVAIVITLSQAHHVRPQLFSLLLFASLLSSLVAAERRSQRWLFALPPLFAVWANLHGGWIVGGAVVAIWAAGLLMRGERQSALRLLVTGAVSLLSTLATPYGFGLWRFLAQTVGLARPEIIEWQPVYVPGWPFVALWLISFAITAIGVLLGGRKDVRFERLLVAVVLAAASFKVARLLAFFGLASVFLFAPAIALAYQRRRTTREFGGSLALRFGFVGVACIVGVFAIGIVRNNFWQLRLDAASLPEPEAVAILKDQPAGKRLLVWFNWGEYAIWHLSPHMRVSIDGRRETVYSENVQTRHFDFYFDRPGGSTLPDDIGADYIWIPRILPAAGRLRNDSTWTPIYDGEQSVIFERTGLLQHDRSPAVIAAATTSRLFPGP